MLLLPSLLCLLTISSGFAASDDPEFRDSFGWGCRDYGRVPAECANSREYAVGDRSALEACPVTCAAHIAQDRPESSLIEKVVANVGSGWSYGEGDSEEVSRLEPDFMFDGSGRRRLVVVDIRDSSCTCGTPTSCSSASSNNILQEITSQCIGLDDSTALRVVDCFLDVNNVVTPTPPPGVSPTPGPTEEPTCEWWCILLIVLGVLLCITIACGVLWCIIWTGPPKPPPPPPVYGDCPAEGACTPCEDASPLIAPQGPACEPAIEMGGGGYGQTVPGYGPTPYGQPRATY